MNSAYFAGLLPGRQMTTGMSNPQQPQKGSFLGQMAQVNQPAILQQTALPPQGQPAMTPLPGMVPQQPMTPGRSAAPPYGALPQQPMGQPAYMQKQPYTPIFRQQETM